MKRRHRVAAEWVLDEPPRWAAMRDGYGGWAYLRVAAELARLTAAARTMPPAFEELRVVTDEAAANWRALAAGGGA